MSEEKDIALIDDFLNGDLTNADLKLFEKRLREDADFKQLHDEVLTIRGGIAYHHRKEFLNELEGVEQKFEDEKGEGKIIPLKANKRRWIWLVAASVVLLVSIGILFKNKTPDTQELYATYYTPYPNIIHPIKRGGENVKGTEINAFHAYEKGEYQNALQLFLSDSVKYQTEGIFYIGNSYLALGNEVSAIEYYDQLIALEDSPYRNQALWYKALAQLKLEDKNAAKLTLEDLLKSKSSYQEKANKILLNLK